MCQATIHCLYQGIVRGYFDRGFLICKQVKWASPEWKKSAGKSKISENRRKRGKEIWGCDTNQTETLHSACQRNCFPLWECLLHGICPFCLCWVIQNYWWSVQPQINLCQYQKLCQYQRLPKRLYFVGFLICSFLNVIYLWYPHLYFHSASETSLPHWRLWWVGSFLVDTWAFNDWECRMFFGIFLNIL